MRDFVSVFIFAGIFLTFGAFMLASAPAGADANFVLPSEAAVVAESKEISAGMANLLPQAQGAEPKYYSVALPLDTSDVITDAASLLNSVSGSQHVLSWVPGIQNFDYFDEEGGGNNYPTEMGAAYLVSVGDPADATFTIVGDVPPPTSEVGAVQFFLLGGSPCQYNFITVPLDHGSVITDAQSLINSIGDVDIALKWLPSIDNFDYYDAGGNGNNFDVEIGYPYFVCAAASKNWPTVAP